MHSSADSLSVGLEILDGRDNADVDSSAAIPVDDKVQEYAASWCCYQGYGSAMDVIHLMVCAVYFWITVGVQLPTWE